MQINRKYAPSMITLVGVSYSVLSRDIEAAMLFALLFIGMTLFLKDIDNMWWETPKTEKVRTRNYPIIKGKDAERFIRLSKKNENKLGERYEKYENFTKEKMQWIDLYNFVWLSVDFAKKEADYYLVKSKEEGNFNQEVYDALVDGFANVSSIKDKMEEILKELNIKIE